jgi:hypothetical protein
MNTYRITGPRRVAGRLPGESVTDDDLVSCNIAALVMGGHLAPNPTRAAKPETNEEK